MRQLIYAVTCLIAFMAPHIASASLIPQGTDVKIIRMQGKTDDNAKCSIRAEVVNGSVESLVIRSGLRVVCSGNHQAVNCFDVKTSSPVVITSQEMKNMSFHEIGKRSVIRGSAPIANEDMSAKRVLRVDFNNGVKNGFYFSLSGTGTSRFDHETRIWCRK
jgi:hypothetical protein